MQCLFLLDGLPIWLIAPTELALSVFSPPEIKGSDDGMSSFWHVTLSEHFVYIDLVKEHSPPCTYKQKFSPQFGTSDCESLRVSLVGVGSTSMLPFSVHLNLS